MGGEFSTANVPAFVPQVEFSETSIRYRYVVTVYHQLYHHLYLYRYSSRLWSPCFVCRGSMVHVCIVLWMDSFVVTWILVWGWLEVTGRRGWERSGMGGVVG